MSVGVKHLFLLFFFYYYVRINRLVNVKYINNLVNIDYML